jgi:hypothetical protein
LFSFKDFNAADSFLVILDAKGFDFSNMHRILQQNSIPIAVGSLDLADSDTHTMPKLNALLINAKLRPLLCTDSSDSVMTSGHVSQTHELLSELGSLVEIFQS